MRKIIATLAIVGTMVVPMASALASFTMTSTALTIDGLTVVTKDPGESVEMVVHGQLSGTGNGSQIQSVKVSFPGTQVGDGTIYDVDDVQLAGSRYVVIHDVVLPNITTGGNIKVKIDFFDNAAHNNQEADGTPFVTKTFTGVVHLRSTPSSVVTVVTPTTGTTGSSNPTMAQLQAQLVALQAQLEAALAALHNPTHPAQCTAALASAVNGMVRVQAYNQGTYNGQQALIGAGFASAQSFGNGPGWFGPITTGVVNQYHMTCGS